MSAGTAPLVGPTVSGTELVVRNHTSFAASQQLGGADELVEKTMGRFDSRGVLSQRGASYSDFREDSNNLEQSAMSPAATSGPNFGNQVIPVGVRYKVWSFGNVNLVSETFEAEVNLVLRHKIPSADVAGYQELRCQKQVDMEKFWSDEVSLEFKLPRLQVANCGWDDYTFKDFRISAISQGFNPATNDWDWYVSWACKLLAICREELHLETFPFTRQALQVHIQAQSFPVKCVFVPFHEPAAMPSWVWLRGGVVEDDLLLNDLRGNADLGNWRVENHHIAFPPKRYTEVTQTGTRFPSFIITIQVRQEASFFLWNTTPLIMSLPLLAGMAVLVPVDALADRLSIVFALLLTMATYKVSITEWMPKKPYLSYLDSYILRGFGCILLIGFVIGFGGLLTRLDCCDEGYLEYLQNVDEATVLVISLVWILWHVSLMCRINKLWPEWDQVMKHQNDKLLSLATRSIESRKGAQRFKRALGLPPVPPPEGMRKLLAQVHGELATAMADKQKER